MIQSTAFNRTSLERERDECENSQFFQAGQFFQEDQSLPSSPRAPLDQSDPTDTHNTAVQCIYCTHIYIPKHTIQILTYTCTSHNKKHSQDNILCYTLQAHILHHKMMLLLQFTSTQSSLIVVAIRKHTINHHWMTILLLLLLLECFAHSFSRRSHPARITIHSLLTIDTISSISTRQSRLSLCRGRRETRGIVNNKKSQR